MRGSLAPAAIFIGVLWGSMGLSEEPKRPAGATAKLSGVVKDPDGAPVANAAVVVSSARPRTGTRRVSTENHPDCMKHAFTDEAGHFTIDGVSDDKVFELLVWQQGCTPKKMTADSQRPPLEIVLHPTRLKLIADGANNLTARVVDPDGKPVAGAIVMPEGYEQGNSGVHGPMDGKMEATVTDADGVFHMGCTLPVTALHLQVRSRGFLRQFFNKVSTGVDATVHLVRGATVRGRILLDGKPRDGVVMGVAGIEHLSGDFFGPWEATTDSDGRFEIVHVPHDKEICLYGKMSSVKEVGSLPMIGLTLADEEDMEVGEISIVPGHRLKGRIKISDGQAIPNDLSVTVQREAPFFDSATAPVREDGSFEFAALPEEVFKLHVSTKGPPRFHLSAENHGLYLPHPFALIGLVDSDVDIVILLDPGPMEFPPPAVTAAQSQAINEKMTELRKNRIQGVAEVVTGK